MSPHSRNFKAGYQVAKDGSVHNFNETNKTTVEGVKAAKIVYEEAQKAQYRHANYRTGI